MIKNNARIVSCPFCGKKKELLSLTSGNTIGSTQWSDGKMVAPMLPSVSPVQKCPHCGKYYLHYKQEGESGTRPSDEGGDLSYREWKEAYQQFSANTSDEKNDNDGLFRRIVQKIKVRKVDNTLDDHDWSVILRGLIYAYNDCHYRGPDLLYFGGRVPNINLESAPSQEEYDFFVKIIERYIALSDWSSTEGKLMKAELYREAGMFELCIGTLKEINVEEVGLRDRFLRIADMSFEQKLYMNILDRAKAKITKVFRIGDDYIYVPPMTEEEKKAVEERRAAAEREWAIQKEQDRDPRWKVCKNGHCFKNTEHKCQWCGEKEFVSRLNEKTPIHTKQLFVGKRGNKWVVTTDSTIEGQTERIRNISVDFCGKNRFYYHMDGKNPHPFCFNTIRLDENTTIQGRELVNACDIIMMKVVNEVGLVTP